MTARTKTWLWSACGVYFAFMSYQDFWRATKESRFQGYFAILIAGLSFYLAFKTRRNEVTAIVPNTKIARIGYCCLSPIIVTFLYKMLHNLTGEPIDYTSRTALILGGLSLFGGVFGFALLGIETIRSAFRE